MSNNKKEFKEFIAKIKSLSLQSGEPSEEKDLVLNNETEIEQWKQRAEKAEAACAEMRVILEVAQRNWVSGKIWTMSANDLNHALSSNCGKDDIHKSELDKTIETLKTIAEGGHVDIGGEITRLETLRKESAK